MYVVIKDSPEKIFNTWFCKIITNFELFFFSNVM